MNAAAGLTALAQTLGITAALMVTIFVASHLLVRYGLVPLSAAFSLSGFNLALFYLLILPGTIIHELSHYLACLATGVRVRQMRLFSPHTDGVVGWVVHDRADPLRRNIIALAPFLGGSLAMYALIRFALPPTDADPLKAIAGDPASDFRAVVLALTDIARSANVHDLKTWLGFYILLSLGYAIAPSRQDLGHLLADGLLAAGCILFIIVVDSHFQLHLAQSSLINRVALALAAAIRSLNALLLLACAAITSGALVIIPAASVVYWLRRSLISE